MLKIASSFIKIQGGRTPHRIIKFGFSSQEKSLITEETFALVMKRL
jgi:hypothetical protein